MCGIAGYLRTDAPARGIDDILAMTQTLRHRGPDDEGAVLIDPSGLASTDLFTTDTAAGAPRTREVRLDVVAAHRLALGHRRFAITDPSPRAHQPLWSWDRRLCVVLNGEIYNHVELRKQLALLGHRFDTCSDTEVLLEAYRAWGVACFRRLIGFWALALFDMQHHGVLLARDRLGKAPLYYARTNRGLWWCSEINGLAAVLGDEIRRVRETAVTDFIVHGVRDVADETFYESVRTFPRASYAWVDRDGRFEPHAYWSLPADRLTERELSPEEAAGALRERLADAVAIRLRADVPVGIELSGGLDSSVLCAIAAESGHEVPVFNAMFPEAEADESPFAQSVMRHLGAEDRLQTLLMERDDFLPHAETYAAHMAEPFHSPGLHANQRLWRAMARQGIRVSVNGAAGDELFAGYPGIHHRPYLAHLLTSGRWSQLGRACRTFSEAPASRLSVAFASRLASAARHALRTRLPVLDTAVARRRRRAILHEPALRLPGDADVRPTLDLEHLLRDTMGDGLLNYWLRSGHQSAMGVPIEVRLPMLDHRVVELALRLPVTYLVRDGWLKWILRRAYERDLPADVVWRRRKLGFPFPMRRWLADARTPLCTMAGASECPYIDAARLAARYDHLLSSDPMLLWRILGVALWWKATRRPARASTPLRTAA